MIKLYSLTDSLIKVNNIEDIKIIDLLLHSIYIVYTTHINKYVHVSVQREKVQE